MTAIAIRSSDSDGLTDLADGTVWICLGHGSQTHVKQENSSLKSILQKLTASFVVDIRSVRHCGVKEVQLPLIRRAATFVRQATCRATQ